jgi:hypothetical protein
MRPLNLPGIFLIFVLLFSSSAIFAQVKIGGDKKDNPHPSALLELQSPDKGFLLPRMTHEQMLAIKEPANALVVFNTDAKSVFIYSSEQQQWLPLLQQVARSGGDSCEWAYDTAASRVFLVRGYPLGDSIFYTTDTRKFVFSDRTENTNSLGQDFPVTSFTGKYYFKATASRFTDSTNLNPTMLNVIFEVDSSGANSFFRGMQIATVNNPKNSGKLDLLSSLGLSTIHSGTDSVLQVSGLTNSTTVNGTGAVSNLLGFTNSVLVRENATKDVLSISGIRNSLNNLSPVSKVNGNVFGYFGSAIFVDSVGAPTVNGNIYGVFLSNIVGAAPKRNYAYYSNKGHNRFGDSTLITDGFTTSPRAVLDINASSAMIIPSGSTLQRPVTGITAMFRNNSDLKVPEFFDGLAWQQLATGTSEWKFDGLNKVHLVRGLPLSDTIFYHTQRKQFVFSDRNTNTNSLGQDFPVESFGAKYTFKTTASLRDSTQFNGANVNMVYEVDNTLNSTAYNALSTSTVMNPKAFQKADLLSGINNTTIHAGNDSVFIVTGINNITRNSGNGKSQQLIGIQNLTRIQNGSGNNTGDMIGIQNALTRIGATAGRVTGNAYGLLQSFSGLTGNVDGSVYGIFVNSVTGAGPRKNYAYYSNKGLNRLGDSLLVTDGASILPRAVLDVNATSAMIVPTGTTAQRPATPVTGMVRYNTTNQTVEAYSGSQWNGIVRATINININNMPPGTGSTVSVVVTGATTGSAVYISPTSALNNGVTIAWSRVSAANTVEVRFENTSGVAVNPLAQNFNIRVIQ